jgi:hypothetical protein
MQRFCNVEWYTKMLIEIWINKDLVAGICGTFQGSIPGAPWTRFELCILQTQYRAQQSYHPTFYEARSQYRGSAVEISLAFCGLHSRTVWFQTKLLTIFCVGLAPNGHPAILEIWRGHSFLAMCVHFPAFVGLQPCIPLCNLGRLYILPQDRVHAIPISCLLPYWIIYTLDIQGSGNKNYLTNQISK